MNRNRYGTEEHGKTDDAVETITGESDDPLDSDSFSHEMGAEAYKRFKEAGYNGPDENPMHPDRVEGRNEDIQNRAKSRREASRF